MPQLIKGISLLELMLVLAISVAIVSLAAPRIVNGLDSIQLKRLSREMAGSLRATRAHAIASGQEAVWLVDLKAHQYHYADKIKGYSEKIIVTFTTASKEQLSDSVATLRFFPDSSATGGEIILSQGKFKYAIQINWLTGRVTIYD